MTAGAGGAAVLRLRCPRRCRRTAVLAGVFAAFFAWFSAGGLTACLAWFSAGDVTAFFAWFSAADVTACPAWLSAAELAGFGAGPGSPDASARVAMPVIATVAHPSMTHVLAVITQPFAMSERSSSRSRA